VKAWCPRCDAVRPGETSCPVCGTALAVLQDPSPTEPDAPPPPEPAVAPPPASRLRLALLAAGLALAGLAFVAGRSGTPPAAEPAPTTAAAAPATTTAAEPDADARELGWRAGRRGVTVTVASARRVVDPDEDTGAVLTLRVEGLQPGQRLLAVRDLRLLDSGGGVYSSPEEQPIGGGAGVPVEPTNDPATYLLFTSPAPRLSALASVEVGDLLVVRPRTTRIQLDSSGPWPAAPPLRAIDPGPRAMVEVPVGSAALPAEGLPLRVTAAFVGAGRAVVVVEPSPGDVVPGGTMPVSGELRAGGQACSRTVLLGQGGSGFGTPEDAGLVLSCPARPSARLVIALGAGVDRLPFDATLKE
jgi:hypothetical protein